MTFFLNNIHFTFLSDPEFFFYRSQDLFRESENLISLCVAIIHEYQRLVLMHTGITLALSFPPALFNEPAGCEFDLFPCIFVTHYCGKFFFQQVELFAADHGGLEKASCVADHM